MAEKVETEVKLRMPGPAEARALVRGLGAQAVRARHLEDNVLLDDLRGTLLASGCALRGSARAPRCPRRPCWWPRRRTLRHHPSPCGTAGSRHHRVAVRLQMKPAFSSAMERMRLPTMCVSEPMTPVTRVFGRSGIGQ